jgi:hypothetical protein
MVVVVGGMVRSGSTFSFNIVREALAQKGSVDVASANSIDASVFAHSDNRHFVLKTHAPDPDVLARIKDGSARCICTVRRPEDAVASLMDAFGFSIEEGIESIKAWLSWYTNLRNQVLTIDYQTIDKQQRLAIERIIDYIGVTCDQSFINSLLEKYSKRKLKQRYDTLAKDEETIDVGFSYYDKRTFFHRRHISSVDSQSAETRLAPPQVARIGKELQESEIGRALEELSASLVDQSRW